MENGNKEKEKGEWESGKLSVPKVAAVVFLFAISFLRTKPNPA